MPGGVRKGGRRKEEGEEGGGRREEGNREGRSLEVGFEHDGFGFVVLHEGR
jgi:hypothetical protein